MVEKVKNPTFLIQYFRNKLSISMNAIEAINKIKTLLGVKLAEEEEKPGGKTEEKPEGKPEEKEEVKQEDVVENDVEETVEDRVAKLEQRMDEFAGKFDEIYKIVVEVVDEANKTEEEKTNPTAEPIHVQQSKRQVAVSPKCARLMELRVNK